MTILPKVVLVAAVLTYYFHAPSPFLKRYKNTAAGHRMKEEEKRKKKKDGLQRKFSLSGYHDLKSTMKTL